MSDRAQGALCVVGGEGGCLAGWRAGAGAEPLGRRACGVLAAPSKISLHFLLFRGVIPSSMRTLLLGTAVLWGGAGMAPAASVRGMVVENQTGHPLARTLVVAAPVAGTSGAAQSTRTNLYGAFALENLPPGAFVISAARKGFAPIQYGQKQWKSAGLPVILEENQKIDIEIRLPRLGAITGRILDENDVGMADHEVVVYHLAKPPQLVANATSDDRGVYRIGSLEPGDYLVRSAARVFEEGSYVPTFFHDVSAVDQARVLEVTLDQQVEDISIHPTPGRLFEFGGSAVCPIMRDATLNLTLVSDMGKTSMTAEPVNGKFRFPPQPPGKYELNLQGTGTTIPCYGYQELEIDRDLTDIRISGTQMPLLRTLLEDSRGGRIDPRLIQMLARRKELSGPGSQQKIDLGGDTIRLLPGRWEFALQPAPGYYPLRFLANGNAAADRADGWNEDYVVSGNGVNSIKFVLSNAPGSVHGNVTLGNQAAAGAPVFLENSGLPSARRLHEMTMVRTDTHGNYQFAGLAPGSYRLLASFEYQSPTSSEFDRAGAVTIQVEEARDVSKDLSLFVER